MSANLALGYAAGALSTLSPCVLPILPIVLFGALERHLWGPVALAAGLAASFAGVGIVIAAFGFSVGIDPGTLRLAIAALMGAAGVVLLVPALQGRVASMASPVAGKGQVLLDRLQPSGILGQFALGAVLGVIWSPCSGPTLGAAIGLAAQGDDLGKAAATMSAFALGAATPILLLAYGSRQAILARRDWMARASRIGKPLMGAAFFGIGLFVLTGLDKIVEASLTAAMPDWLVNVTTRL
ncbi:cytochrome c biogenesis CcdA family protein [Bradyrhizobium betae]|uniref:Cytochrome c biogenesis protein CcdA n=1 Tax=Bradyrhizobium betae TaxID=244734 RepID=A0A5P6NYX4_9BRAD|nr:cytochrome c biogenesis CcdA family protein [Bradyrhizobium betae]MCS3725367.1 cytochrome c biogenesis protein CcdA [Bradyrhizobium betae]QFI71327.1 cytochrome c biogenesis protein CcdA [Bradyrhizobium betae]